MDTGLIEYTTATRMAAVYKSSVARIKELIVELGQQCQALKAAFDDGHGYAFDVEVYWASTHSDANQSTADAVAAHMKRAAWRQLFEKLGIRKIMSSKRIEEMDAATGLGRSRYGNDPIQELPDIDEETIIGVLRGMVSSAGEFLEEAIHEEYDFWKPSKDHADYVRNSEFRLNRRIIRPCIIERGYGKEFFRPSSYREQHVIALDNIFHALDGAGIPPGHYGPLAEAIRTSGPEGKFETAYFRGRCYKNGNLHLEFKRLDLLAKFNELAGRNRLPAPDDC